jgi:hypothetical protein
MERTIQTKIIGNHIVRTVIVGDRESWTKYTIVPRELALKTVRRVHCKGYSYSSCSEWPQWLDLNFHYPRYGGPGRAFASDVSQYKRNRRFIVFHQHGGIDI